MIPAFTKVMCKRVTQNGHSRTSSIVRACGGVSFVLAHVRTPRLPSKEACPPFRLPCLLSSQQSTRQKRSAGHQGIAHNGMVYGATLNPLDSEGGPSLIPAFTKVMCKRVTQNGHTRTSSIVPQLSLAWCKSPPSRDVKRVFKSARRFNMRGLGYVSRDCGSTLHCHY